MQGLLKKGYDLNYAQSRAPSIIDAQGQQSSVSRNLSFRKVSPRDCFQSSKELHLHFEEDHESPSTQSTGQSCPEEGTLETKGYGNSAVSIKPSYCGTNVKSEEDQSKSTITFQDNGLSFSSIDYRQHASVPCAYPDPYQLGIFAAYGHFPVVQVASEMMGMVPARVLLPPDAPQDDPIYVNAKQIRAILRRRESRAKLEAQNKLPRARKPYLHESRHRHALKRARGSGGRFLNTKMKLHESSKDMDEPNAQDISSPFQLRLRTATAAGSEAQKEGISISTTSSTSTCVASSIENLFHSQDFRFSHL